MTWDDYDVDLDKTTETEQELPPAPKKARWLPEEETVILQLMQANPDSWLRAAVLEFEGRYTKDQIQNKGKKMRAAIREKEKKRSAKSNK